MQLHPDDGAMAVQHTSESLCSGFIGLDFEHDVGDLIRATQQSLPPKQRDYWQFAHSMTIGDRVLIIAHHFPFALLEVSGEYNYIRTPVPEIGVWFRHFRRVKDVKYYRDWVTNPASWQRLIMTDTICVLNDPNSESYRLIQAWP